MVTKFGMSDRIGPICYGNDHDEVFIGRDFVQSRNMSEHVSAEIDDEIRGIIDTAYDKCKKMLSDNIEKLHAVVKILMDREKISGEEFEKVFNGEELNDNNNVDKSDVHDENIAENPVESTTDTQN